ncbi:MAG: alpha/beta hydrolase [Litorimonas sp.]
MTDSTLLCLPGNMCDASLWADCLPSDTGLRTVKPVPPGTSISDMAAWCLSAYEGPLLPVGFSMGGIVALECLRQAPKRITGLVLIATNPGADRPDRLPVRLRQQKAVIRGGLERVVTDELMPNYFAEANAGRHELAKHVLEMATSVGPEAFVSQSEALRQRDDLWPTLDTFDKPVLILCGSEDRVCPPDLHYRIADASEDSTLQIVAEAGHMLPIEQPAAVRSHIGDWLLRNGFTPKEDVTP